ncbi:MAG TPA: ribosome maturation factor RimM [Pyrinomonadaceae bacterium]|nr:ribosome maturation factor RimM [Pyrinomonadaceae bacterium]
MSGEHESEEDLVVVARAVRTRGLKGEIVAELLTDFPERFEKVKTLIAISPGGGYRSVKLEDHWFQKDRVVLKFDGIDTIESARELIDHNLAVPESESVSLPENHYYDWELEGCDVRTTTKESLGRVKAVMRTGGVEILVVAKEDKTRDYLLPLAESIVVEINPEEKYIVVDPPEGLLDL